jgi:hypothetical protein
MKIFGVDLLLNNVYNVSRNLEGSPQGENVDLLGSEKRKESGYLAKPIKKPLRP